MKTGQFARFFFARGMATLESPYSQHSSQIHMKSKVFRAVAVLAATLLAASASAQGQPPLETVQLQTGLYLIKAEVAATYGTRMQGLMMREKMGANEGMLFVFPDRDKQCMWMKNTLLPLSVAFLDESGAILNVEDMKPQTEDSHCSAKPARYALEMNLGWFKSKNIKPGTKISGLEKAGPPR